MAEEKKQNKRRGKYGRLLHNTLVLTIGTFASKLLVFLLLPLYTGYLTTGEYGVADLIANLANFLIPIFGCGLSEGVLRFSLQEVSEDGMSRYRRKGVFSAALILTLLGSSLCFVLLPFLKYVPEMGSYGILVILYVISANLHSIAAEYIRASEKTTLYSVQGVLNTVLVIVLNLFFLLGLDAGVNGYVLSIILADFFTTVFITFAAKLYREFSFLAIEKGTARALLKFSVPLIPGLLLWWVISVSDRYLLTWISGAEENGLYVAAAKIPTMITLLCTVFLTAWKTSAVTEDGGSDEESRKKKAVFYGNVYRGYVALLFCAAAVIILFSKVFAKILFSDAFYIAWQYIPILTVGTIFYNLSRFLGSVYFVKKKSLRSSVTVGIAAIINVALNLFLIPKFGAFGAAAATLVAYFVEYAVRDFDAQREIRFPSERLRILICGILILAEMAVVTFTPPYWIWISAALTTAVCAICAKALISMLKNLLRTIRSKKVYN